MTHSNVPNFKVEDFREVISEEFPDTIPISCYLLADKSRLKVYSTLHPEITDHSKFDHIVAVTCKRESEGDTVEHIIGVHGKTMKVFTGSCQVTFEDQPLTGLVEYQFPEDVAGGVWRLASVTELVISDFKNKAFAVWEDQIKHPNCEAAFKRLLQAGPVSRVFDKHLFPTPPEYSDKYKVVNEKDGKLIILPHPVTRLRIWQAAHKRYRDIDPTLDGAPRGEDETLTYFNHLLADLKSLMGSEYVDSMLGSSSTHH